MSLNIKKGAGITLASVLAMSTVLAACSKDSKGTTSSTSPSASTSASPSAAPTNTKPVKLRVMLYDRGVAPEGMKLTEAPVVTWAVEQVKKIGIDLEWVPVPRAQAGDKLNVWLASGDSPDIVFTYDQDVLFKYAEQGGLWELGPILDKLGPQIKKNNEKALAQAGTYKGKRYAIPALRANAYGGPTMKVRQDWLDKLGMKMPTTIDEFYNTLKAFKEKDPGGVGKDKVVPFDFTALGKVFQYYLSISFGIDVDGPTNDTDLVGGKVVNGKFVSNVALPEGKEYLMFLNKLYKEGLIPKEFATDVNKQQFNQYLTTGVAGFMEDNNAGQGIFDTYNKKDLPTARWVTVPPFVRKDGKQILLKNADFGMFLMVPKSSKQEQAEAAVKFLNWMADPSVIYTLQSGIEGVHWKMQDGLQVPIDPEKNKKEVGWNASYGDLALIQQGQPADSYDILLKKYKASSSIPDPEYYAKEQINNWDLFKKYGQTGQVLQNQRPIANKNKAQIGKFLNESMAKIIIASDAEKEYNAMIDGWKKLEGEGYDLEITDGLKQIGFIK